MIWNPVFIMLMTRSALATWMYPSQWYLIVVTRLKQGGEFSTWICIDLFYLRKPSKDKLICCAISIFHLYLYLFCICFSFLQYIILFSFANKHEIIIVCRSFGNVSRDTILKDARQLHLFARRLFALQIQIGPYANKITHGYMYGNFLS